jgi:uncharacterized protein with PIN domain
MISYQQEKREYEALFYTSAIVKFFHEEKGSKEVTKLIASSANTIWVSALVRLEFLSVLFRRLRNRELNKNMLNKAIAGFFEELNAFNMDEMIKG